MEQSKNLPPSLCGYDLALSSVLLQTHGAAGEIPKQDLAWYDARGVRSAMKKVCSDGEESDPHLDHEPNPCQLNGGPHEDLETK
jgi:hypothetical protein